MTHIRTTANTAQTHTKNTTKKKHNHHHKTNTTIEQHTTTKKTHTKLTAETDKDDHDTDNAHNDSAA